MGCTHSKNSKSKAAKTKTEHPLERAVPHNRISHFDETNQTDPSTSNESEEQQPPQYSKNLLNETGETTNQRTAEPEKGAKKQETKNKTTTGIQTNEHLPTQTKNHSLEISVEKKDSPQHTAIAPGATSQPKQYVASMYYPMPTIGEKQKSPEKKKPRKKSVAPAPVQEQVVEQQPDEKKKKKEYGRDRSAIIGPNFRPQLTPEDLECIRRSVQQRNERRAYMMAHRNETDDTLYELEVRMPEKDYTNRIEAVAQNSRAY